MLLKLSSLTIPALWVAHIAAAQTAPAAYTLIQTNSMGGAASTVTLYRDGNLVVSDTQQDTTRTRTLSNLSTHTSTSWDVANPSNGCSSGTFSGDWGDPFVMSAEFMKEINNQNPKPAGKETINGFSANVIEGTSPSGKAKVWMDPATGLMVKAQMTAPNQPPQVLFEVKKLTAGKPPAAVFKVPAACTAAPPPPPAPTNPDFVDAIQAPPEPSDKTCTVLVRVVRSGTLEPMTSGFEVGADMKGTGRSDMTSSLRNGTLRLDNVPSVFDVNVRFPNGGESFGHIYRRCFAPQTVLVLIVKNPEKITDGADWRWAKSGKLAH